MVDDPALRVYMRQVDVYPLLTRDEQTAAAKEFRRAAGRYQCAMLTSDFVLAHAADALEEVLTGKRRIEFVVEVGVGSSAEKRRIKALLPSHLQQLRCLLQRNADDFRVAICRRVADADRRAAWRRLVARRHQAARLVVELKLRAKHVSRFFGKLCEIAHRMEELKNRLRRSRAKGGRSRAIRSELVRLMKLTRDSPSTLRRRIERAAARQEEYGKAKHVLAVSGLRLVLSLARMYRGRGVGFSDLIQEGNVGLLRAVEKFDPRRGSFSNCARWWIRHAICLAVARQTRMPTIPKTMRDAVDRVRHVRFRFAQEFARQLTLDETAAACRLSLRETEAALLFSQPPLSIDQREPSQGMKRFADLLRAANGDPAKHASHTLDWELVRSTVADAMQRLDDRQKRVISLRFGFADGESRSLRQVAAVMSISHEYVRQVAARAMAKLRTPALETLAVSWFR